MKTADYDRVTRCIIEPMKRFYGLLKMDDLVVEAFVEDLGGYSEAVLNDAFRQVRREVRMKPSLAHFVSACEDVRERSKPPPAPPPKPKAGNACRTDYGAVKAVFGSPVGRQAVGMGVAYDVWLHAWRDGRTEFAEVDLRTFKLDAEETIRLLTHFQPKDSPTYRTFERWHRQMADKEAELRAKFLPRLTGS